jgi:hypothetical protein
MGRKVEEVEDVLERFQWQNHVSDRTAQFACDFSVHCSRWKDRHLRNGDHPGKLGPTDLSSVRKIVNRARGFEFCELILSTAVEQLACHLCCSPIVIRSIVLAISGAFYYK